MKHKEFVKLFFTLLTFIVLIFGYFHFAIGINSNTISSSEASGELQVAATLDPTSDSTSTDTVESTLENSIESSSSEPMETTPMPESSATFTEPVPNKVAYLTFDDGPTDHTPQLLDILDQYQVKATFFITGQFLNESELITQIQDMVNRGHQVAVHTFSHQYKYIYGSVDNFLSDYNQMDDIILKATGNRSKLYRFPGGSNTPLNAAVRDSIKSILSQKGVIYFDWNAYDGDCDGLTGEALIKQAITQSFRHDSAILLMHDLPDFQFVLDALPSIITQLRNSGYSFATLDETVPPVQFK